MGTQIWVNIGSGNGLLPDGTKPLPEVLNQCCLIISQYIHLGDISQEISQPSISKIGLKLHKISSISPRSRSGIKCHANFYQSLTPIWMILFDQWKLTQNHKWQKKLAGSMSNFAVNMSLIPLGQPSCGNDIQWFIPDQEINQTQSDSADINFKCISFSLWLKLIYYALHWTQIEFLSQNCTWKALQIQSVIIQTQNV